MPEINNNKVIKKIKEPGVEISNGAVIKMHPFTITNEHTKEEYIDNWNTFERNKPDKKSLIATYTIQSDRIIFDPDDKSQEILFAPFDENGNFIRGELEIIRGGVKSNDSYAKRIYHANTFWMNPSNPLFNFGHLRCCQYKVLGVRTDIIKVYFKSKKVFVPKNSILMIKVRAGNIDLNGDKHI